MAQIGAPGHDPVPIGEVAAPPFVRLPDPAQLFAGRAARFRELAAGHGLGPYLTFLAGIADIQHAIQAGLAEPGLPGPEERARSRQFAMPPLDTRRFPADAACRGTLSRFLAEAAGLAMPAAAAAALKSVVAADADARAQMARAVLDDAIPFEELAAHVLVAAALQVHAARAAARLEGPALVPVGEGQCPACGSAPAASLVVGWQGAHGARYCACSLCGTLWNYVRIRCTACGTTKGIGYREVDGTPGTIKAETCQSCRTYLKILYQVKDAALDPVADDVASSALDVLVSETGMRRSGRNPFLLGY